MPQAICFYRTNNRAILVTRDIRFGRYATAHASVILQDDFAVTEKASC